MDKGVEFAASTFDGKLGAVPGIKPSHDSIQVLYIRKDWLDKLNLDDPKSHQDVLDIMQAFVEQDPDGNGVDDTYALGLSGDIWNTLYGAKGFAAAYGAFPSIWYANGDGGLVYGSVQPEMKDALGALRNLYEKNWLDPEFVVTNINETVVGGKGVAMA